MRRRRGLRVPVPVGKGRPASSYPFAWAIYGWIDGQPARLGVRNRVELAMWAYETDRVTG